MFIHVVGVDVVCPVPVFVLVGVVTFVATTPVGMGYRGAVQVDVSPHVVCAGADEVVVQPPCAFHHFFSCV